MLNNNIITFIIFALVIIFLYHVTCNSLKKYILLAGNALFYASLAANWEVIIIFSCEIIFSYYMALLLARYRNKIFLTLSIIPVVMTLAFTKYNFIASGLFHEHTLKLIIPAGISFYTLKIIAYYTEIYDGKIKQVPLIDYINYISMFTQILSGPVMRINEFTQDLTRLEFNYIYAKSGAFLILAGLFKKLCAANMITSYVNSIHGNISGVPGLSLWLAAFLYAIEIYADFSGWSDISNGLMQILGFRETKNFYAPYFSSNIKEFWTRWHISFSSWLRDYIYIPLGGSRCTNLRKFINVIITFLVSGIWHGSGINFLLWGIAHGLGVYFISKKNKFLTFIIVILLWIPFRSIDFNAAINYYSCMITNFDISLSAITNTILIFTGDNTCAVYAVILFAEIFILFLYDLALTRQKNFSGIFTFIFAVMIILFGRVGESAFIYAQF